MSNSNISFSLQQTAENLRRELRRIEEEKARITADLDKAANGIAAALQQLGYSATRATSPRSVGPSGKKKRIRRNPGQLKKYAEGVYQLVKSAGANGASGAQIRREFPKVGQDIKGFVHKHAGGRLKTTGKKSFMRYTAG
ncbi:MAG TPA: hypothetical protein VG722_04510 [Tepidisphaeraceae bacterium]|nr:hypothetical protein [Tepidisphaeraceae bacterium]